MGKHSSSIAVRMVSASGALFAVATFFLTVLCASRAEAIPAFSREYKTECTTCHTVFPQRNEFGQAFEENGFVWPGAVPMSKKVKVSQTEEERKSAEYIKLSGIPAVLPLSVALNISYLYDEKAEDSFDMKRYSAEIFGAGAFGGNRIGFWYNQGLGSQSGGPEAPSQLYFVARELFGAPVNVKAGKFQPNVSIWRGSDHLIGRPLSIGYSVGSSPNATPLSTAQNGLELTSVLASRVFVAVGMNDRNNAPAGTAEKPISSNSVNDFYGRVSAKIGGSDYHGAEPEIDLDKDSVWDYLYVTFGGFGYSGSTSTGDGVNNDLTRYGVEAGAGYKKLLLMTGYTIGENNPTAKTTVDSSAWSAEVNYVFNPMFALALRYDAVAVDGKDDRTVITPGILWAPMQSFKFGLRVAVDSNPTNANTGKAVEKTTATLTASMVF